MSIHDDIPFYRYSKAKVKAREMILRDVLTLAVRDMPKSYYLVWVCRVDLDKNRTIMYYN